jgi:hypothetical protein
MGPAHCLSVCRIREKHTRAHNVVGPSPRIGKSIEDDLEAAASLNVWIGVTRTVRPHGSRTGYQDSVSDSNRTAKSDNRFVRRAREDISTIHEEIVRGEPRFAIQVTMSS